MHPSMAGKSIGPVLPGKPDLPSLRDENKGINWALKRLLVNKT